MNRTQRILKAVLPIAVLLLGAGALWLLIATRPQPEQSQPEKKPLLVEVQRVRSERHEVHIDAQGTVTAARKVQLQPQVSGRVIWHDEDLEPGGRLDKNEPVLRIDPRDYRLAVESREADVSKARLELRLEKSRKDIAEREWKLFSDEGTSKPPSKGNDAGPPLALREPQVQTAKVALKSARSALRRARLDLERTTLRAPFNALVLEEHVDEGQLIGPQATVATLVGTDRFWVRVSVPVEAIDAIDVPGINGAKQGSRATVSQDVGERRVERSGRVVRLLGSLDRQGSMARVLVAIDDPLGLERKASITPMLLDSYVHVGIDVPPLEDVIEVPRAALREGDRIYVMNDDNRMEIRKVDIAWRRKDSVLLSGGVRDGERIITSPIPTPADGLPVRASPTATPQEAEARGAVAEARKGPAPDSKRDERP